MDKHSEGLIQGVTDVQHKKLKQETQNGLDQLKALSVVVVDSGDFEVMKDLKPQDATTNPTLILQASQKQNYQYLIDQAIDETIQEIKLIQAKQQSPVKKGKKTKKQIQEEQQQLLQQAQQSKFDLDTLTTEQQKLLLRKTILRISVNFGEAISKIVPGYISTQIDARLSYDASELVKLAKELIDVYEAKGVNRSRILVKLAATWEGIQAAKKLKKLGINCNMTLIFNYHQAIACGQANVKLISPFVGRILDYYKKANPDQDYSEMNDPGVKSVSEIYNFFKKYDITTIVMGASFRSLNQILNLAGCDRLTIAANYIQALQDDNQIKLDQKLNAQQAKQKDIEHVVVTEQVYRWQLNRIIHSLFLEDAMATEKLSDGIRKFAEDTVKLESIIMEKVRKRQ